jgi:hypothetical protein
MSFPDFYITHKHLQELQTIHMVDKLQINLIKDKFSSKEYIEVRGIEQYHEVSKAIKDSLRQYIKEKTPIIAQVGPDVTVKIDEQASRLLIFRDAKAREVRKYIFDDETEYTHQLKFQTAEFHGYMEISQLNQNLEPINSQQFGAAPIQKGALYGKIYVRQDDYYIKYSLPEHIKMTPGVLNPLADKGCLSITFDITTEQYNKFNKTVSDDIKNLNKGNNIEAIKTSGERFFMFTPRFDMVLPHFIQDGIKYFYSLLPQVIQDGIEYFFSSPIARNCHDYNTGVFHKVISNYSRPFDYVKIDETDLNDMGVQYQLSEYSLSETLYFYAQRKANSPAPYHFPYIKNFNRSINSNNVNEQNPLNNNTKLHEAVLAEKYHFIEPLLSLGADANIKNSQGQIPLGILAGISPDKSYLQKFLDISKDIYHHFFEPFLPSVFALPPQSPDKYFYLQKLLAVTKDINTPELRNTAIPLTKAVLANDEKAVSMMLAAGANASFINDVGDSLIQVALIYNAYKVVDELHGANPKIILGDNGEHQFPIAVVCNNIEKFDMENFGELCNSFNGTHFNGTLYSKSPEELLHFPPVMQEQG